MDAQTLLALELFGYYLAACLFSATIGNVLIGTFVRCLTHPSGTTTNYRRLASTIGSVERVVYISAILIGRPEFIGIYLLVKVAGDWGNSRKSTDDTSQKENPGAWVGISPEYMVFLIGNLLSILLAVGLAMLLQGLLPPFPSLRHWTLPT